MRKAKRIFILLLFGAVILGGVCLAALAVVPVSLTPVLGGSTIETENYRLSFSTLELDFAAGLRIRAKDVEMSFPGFPTPARLGELTVKLQTLPLFSGRVLPRTITAKRLSLEIKRTAEGWFLAGMPLKQEKKGNEVRPHLSLVNSIATAHERSDPAARYFTALKGFALEDSEIIIDDALSGQRWRADRLKADVENRMRSRRDAFFDLSAELHLMRNEQEIPVLLSVRHNKGAPAIALQASAEIADLGFLAGYLPQVPARAVNAPAAVRVRTSVDADNSLSSLDFEAVWTAGDINLPPVGRPLPFLEMKASGVYAPSSSRSANVSVRLIDTERMTVRLDASWSEAGIIEAGMQLSDTTIDHLALYLPHAAQPQLSSWLDANLNNARVTKARFHMKGPLSAIPFAVPSPDSELTAAFDFEGLEVSFWDKLPPGKMLDGSFSMDRGRITTTASRGKLGAETVTDLKVDIYDVFKSNEPLLLDVSGKASGEAAQAVEVIEKLLGPAKEHLQAQGTNETSVRLSLPLTQRDKGRLTYSIDSVIRGLHLAVPGTGLPFSSETASIKVTEEQFSASASGKTAEQPADVNISAVTRRFRDTITIASTTKLSGAFLETYVPPAYIRAAGILPLQLDIKTAAGNQPGAPGAPSWQFLARLDLSQAALSLPWHSWEKQSGRPASVRVEGSFDPAQRTASFDSLLATGPDFLLRGRGRLAGEGQWKPELDLDQLTLGRTDVRVAYRGGQVKVSGPRLDLSALKQDEKKKQPEEGPSISAEMDIGEVVLTSGSLHKVSGRLSRDAKGWNELSVQARIGQGATADALLQTENGRSKLLVRSSEAGTLLSILGIGDHIYGGRLELEFFPAARELKLAGSSGKITIREAQVKNSPILLQILSLLSVERWMNPNEGTTFRKIALPFRFDKVLFVENGKLEGPLLTMYGGGTVNLETKDLDLRINAVPLRSVGQATEVIPLIGDAVSGLQKNLLGAQFTVKGTMQSPKVALDVNPFQ